MLSHARTQAKRNAAEVKMMDTKQKKIQIIVDLFTHTHARTQTTKAVTACRSSGADTHEHSGGGGEVSFSWGGQRMEKLLFEWIWALRSCCRCCTAACLSVSLPLSAVAPPLQWGCPTSSSAPPPFLLYLMMSPHHSSNITLNPGLFHKH